MKMKLRKARPCREHPFVRFWIHGEHLLVDGEKMAKSEGNFFTLRDLLRQGISNRSKFATCSFRFATGSN